MDPRETGASDGEALSKSYASCGGKEELIIITIIIITNHRTEIDYLLTFSMVQDIILQKLIRGIKYRSH
jgi:hypothetical protein